MDTKKTDTEKGRTLTTIGIIFAGLLLFNLIKGAPDDIERTIQHHSDYARDLGVKIVSAAIPPKASPEFDFPSILVSQIGATTYQLAGSLYTSNNSAQKHPYSWYLQIEAIPHCFDYNLYSCWVIISGPTITPD